MTIMPKRQIGKISFAKAVQISKALGFFLDTAIQPVAIKTYKKLKEESMEAYSFVSLARECDLLAILHALLDNNLKNLLLLDNLLTFALGAAVLVTDGLAGALALIAWVLHLLDH